MLLLCVLCVHYYAIVVVGACRVLVCGWCGRWCCYGMVALLVVFVLINCMSWLVCVHVFVVCVGGIGFIV